MLGLEEDRITGVMVQYYKSCKRELWLFSHGIDYNEEDENILIGRQIHEDSYRRKRKNLRIGPVSFDYTEGGDNVTVFEVKKSSSLVEPALYQVYYYLWYLKQRGVNARGCLVYPKEHKRETVELTPGVEEEIQEILRDITKIKNMPRPPEVQKKSHCRGCSYYEFCMT
jgi:CRISPR-associated exonuclease Cas4